MVIAESVANGVPYKVSGGRHFPLGAKVKKKGVNFAIFSAHAQKVEVCIFDPTGTTELQRIALPEYTDEVWHGFVEGLPEGALYGYRVYGPFDPHNGHRFNPHKLLIDPYAKAFFGELVSSDIHLAYDSETTQKDLTIDTRDNAAYMPKCVVTKELKHSNTHPRVKRRDTILYELHVKGFTKQHPDIPVEFRGTYKGLASKEVIKFFKKFGMTSIELLPVHSFYNEPFLTDKGLSNYWGYNSYNFFVPEGRYSHSGEVSEFKEMVEALHAEGIEVILDVVYNHTAEGNELGPTLSFKGIDNASYYRLHEQNKRYYDNYSGCGNTLNIAHPRVMQMVADSLRYWVEVMGVDGFRFDLASILGRENPHFNSHSQFFTVLKQDPVLSTVKMIAEPWDIGMGGYQLGRFPHSWMEWNDRFRDTVRRFWRGDEGIAPEFARRLHGSADLFERPSRRPSSSVNFITSHDGFTLHDLVSYNDRHNEANGEDNRDGHSCNFSANYGHEGPTDDPDINRLRQRQKRNMLATLMVAQGTPMMLAGDAMGNTQGGNNNAYCQDNEISWIDWTESSDVQEVEFLSKAIQFRKDHPLLNRPKYHHGNTVSVQSGLPDICWLNCRGQLMEESDWHNSDIKCFAMQLAQTEEPAADKKEEYKKDDALLIIFNAHRGDIDYKLPVINGYWQVIFNTADEQHQQGENISLADSSINVQAFSCVGLSLTVSTAAKKEEKNLI